VAGATITLILTKTVLPFEQFDCLPYNSMKFFERLPFRAIISVKSSDDSVEQLGLWLGNIMRALNPDAPIWVNNENNKRIFFMWQNVPQDVAANFHRRINTTAEVADWAVDLFQHNLSCGYCREES